MPTYDYICTACGHEMEVVHGIHSHGPAACPVCGGRMRKGFAAPAVHFKGSGWAKKDRGAAATTKAAAKAGGEAESTSKKHDRQAEGSSSGTADKSGKDKGSGESTANSTASSASSSTTTAGTD